MTVDEREFIADALEAWVSCGYNGAKASEIARINYYTLNKWINRYYTRLRPSEETITLKIPSKV